MAQKRSKRKPAGRRKGGIASSKPSRGVDGCNALNIVRMTISAEALRNLPVEQSSAILLLGHFLNEANWLRKLMLASSNSIAYPPTPDGQANFALAVQLVMSLAGKIHEGNEKIKKELWRLIPNAKNINDELGVRLMELGVIQKN